MEKYKTFEFINEKDVTNYSGLENEVLTYIDRGDKSAPLIIECFGITFPDKNYSIKRTSSNYFIIEYIVDGIGHLKTKSHQYVLTKGNAILLKPHSSHYYYSDANNPYKKYWINFSSDIFNQIINEYGLDEIDVFKNVDLSDEFSVLFHLEKQSTKNDRIYKQASAIIFKMIMKLAETVNKKPKESSLAIEIQNKLDDAITSNISIESICADLYISKSKLMREFKKYYKQTPHQYLLNRKISYAKTLLRNTNYPIKSISDRLNFADEHYFSNVFRSKTSKTPTQYREDTTNIKKH